MDGRWRTAIINALIIVLKTVFTNLAWMAYTYTVIKRYSSIRASSRAAAAKRAGLPEENMPAEKISYALNQKLPEDIVVVDSCEVSDDFHPRFSKSRKTYEYRILNARFRNPTRRLDTYFYHYPLDTAKMSEAAKYLIGEHDFASFCSANSQAQTTVRTIYDCTVSKAGDIITIRVTGNGFLYNMVRIIAGTLVKIGGSDMPADAMKGIIAATDRAAAGPTAPAHGLTMIGLEYE